MDIRISIDDGCQTDLWIAELLTKHGLKGTFYISPYYRQHGQPLKVRQIKRLAKFHEIGGHTLNHTTLTNVDAETARAEIEEGKTVLEAIIESEITKFCYPKGWFNEKVKRYVREAGFKEARTMKTEITDISGYDKFEIPVTLHVYPQRVDKFEELWDRAKSDGYFHLVMHSWEVLKFDLEERLEQILKTISNEN